MNYDDNFSFEEMRLMETLKGKSRMEADEIVGEYEKRVDNG
jgi:hypothetical protein